MTRSKNEIKEKRGTISCVVILLFFTGLIGGTYFWIMHTGNNFSEKASWQKGQKQTNKEVEVLEGRLIWNLTQFQSFYGLEDSLVKKYIGTIEYFINTQDVGENDKEVNEYLYLKEMDLLFSPCQFLIINEQRCRVYFNKNDHLEINKTDWINKSKKEKKHTFLKMKLTKMKDLIYKCEEILEINERLIE